MASRSCAICYLVPGTTTMPCCGVSGSSMIFCLRCLNLICEQNQENVGSCPACRKQYKIQDGEVVLYTLMGQCRYCCHDNKELDNQRLCENCQLGDNYHFRYICNRCDMTQVIPHPMWKYQAKPDQFGTDTWFCHQRCNDQTNWRITLEDVEFVPSVHVPATWGLRETWLQEIRELRNREQQQ